MGYSTFDPTRIEGDGMANPAFDPDEDEPAFPAVEPRFDVPEPEEPSSPLVALGTIPTGQPPTQIPDGLVVMNFTASYEGQAVFLSEAERAAISSIVLKALANRIKEQHKALKLPKQTRVRRTEVPLPRKYKKLVEAQMKDAGLEGLIVKRKRGRPRKIQQEAVNAEGNQEAQRG